MVDVMLCVGHSRLGDKCGAVSVLGDDEYQFNFIVANKLLDRLSDAGISAEILSNYPHRGYTQSMKWVGQQCRRADAVLAVELHFNSSSRPSASGHEWLIYKHSQEGHRLASCFRSAMIAERPDAADRGVKSLHHSTDRGFGFVAHTPCPAVVLEPFFGSHAPEANEFILNPDKLAGIYSKALETYLTTNP